MTITTHRSDVLVIGAGLAGIVTTIELLQKGKSVTLVDRAKRERLGGLALWAFGGMALINTPLQRRMKLHDSPELALEDWLRFGEFDRSPNPNNHWSKKWAEYYVEQSCNQVYNWVIAHGLKFMPAVNWVERGMQGDGNSVPRYHILWGTAQRLTRCLIDELFAANTDNRLKLLCNHEVTSLETTDGSLSGATGIDHESEHHVQFAADVVVLAMGGINGSHAEVRRNWPHGRPLPSRLLNGAHPDSDGKLHRLVESLGGQITNAGEMWNYAAGIPHPQAHFPDHGLSLIPCKSALWLNHRGERIGPQPLVTGFDTHHLCQQIAAQEKPYTWQLLNWRIAVKELAISGTEHNQRIRDQQFILFLKELVFGNQRLVRQMVTESPQFIVDDTLAGLTQKMNALTGSDDVQSAVLQATADKFDANFARGNSIVNDDQIRRIEQARHWGPDKLRTCKPAPLQDKTSGPFIAIQLQLITRKSLGGLQTDLESRVLDFTGQPISGLYCVGEAAGFGGGGASGKRSLEGTFLPGCVLTARAAARSIK